jgi:hypothetical protein
MSSRGKIFRLLAFSCLFLLQAVSCQRAIVSLGKRIKNRFGSKQPPPHGADESTTGEERSNADSKWCKVAVATILFVALGKYSRKKFAGDANFLYPEDGEFMGYRNRPELAICCLNYYQPALTFAFIFR